MGGWGDGEMGRWELGFREEEIGKLDNLTINSALPIPLSTQSDIIENFDVISRRRVSGGGVALAYQLGLNRLQMY